MRPFSILIISDFFNTGLNSYYNVITLPFEMQHNLNGTYTTICNLLKRHHISVSDCDVFPWVTSPGEISATLEHVLHAQHGLAVTVTLATDLLSHVAPDIQVVG